MKIAYIMYPGACYMGAGDGSKMQAEIWINELRQKGHEIDRISPWGHYNWKSYDIIHVFGFGLWNYDIIHWGSGLNPNFVFSPIIDSNTPIWKYRMASHFGCQRLRLFSQNYALRKLRTDIKLFFDDASIKKEPFCLFAGTMTQPRKNVPRLIMAAKKYGFALKLVGNKGNARSEAALKALIGEATNIEILGFVNDEELISLYNRAKVFALPSINEGVGLVALEAAIHGCNVVVTNLGGPKEYYEEGTALLVNPYDIDDIGQAVIIALEDNTSQPALRERIMQKYSASSCVDLLIKKYQELLT